MSERIYLDNNATTPLDEDVAQIIKNTLTSAWGNPSSSYPEGVKAREVISAARKQVANAINASEHEVLFVSGGTEANNWVITTAIEHFRKSRDLACHPYGEGHFKPHIVSTTVEHDAVSLPLEFLRKRGEIDVTFVPVNRKYGFITAEDISAAICPNTCLVTVIMANNETGVILPIQEISDRIRNDDSLRHKPLIHTDAAQAIGKIPVDVRALGVDYLTIVGHKFYGPRIGALFVRDLQEENGAPLYKIFHGGAQERNLRPGTENTPMIAGLGKAADIAREYLSAFSQDMEKTRDYLEKRLKDEFKGRVVFNCNTAPRLPNTCSVAFIGEDLEGYKLLQRIAGFSCSTGSACHSDECKPSQILLNFYVPFQVAANTLRISTGRNTTVNDVDKAVAELKRIILSHN